MRELLERLRDRRGQCDAPPIGAVLEAATPRPVPRPPSVQGLFRGLDEGPVEAGEGTDLRDALAHFQEQRPSPGDLFGDLDGGGEGGGSRSGKRRRRKKRRRPRPRD